MCAPSPAFASLLSPLLSSLCQAIAKLIEEERTEMEYADFKATFSSPQAFASNYNSSSSSPSSSSCSSPPSSSGLPPSAAVVLSPCAACKILRRRCSPDKCVLAPYFPPTDPLKFTTAHRVFGASNINKLLQELPESQRADAVSSMVYEANARIRDPVYGCAGAICQLQKQVSDLQGQLARAQADLLNMQCQQAHLLTLLCMDVTEEAHQQSPIALPMQPQPCENWSFFSDDASLGVPACESLWA